MLTYKELCMLDEPPVMVELYRIGSRANGWLCYASGRDTVTFNSQKYVPAPVKRSTIKFDNNITPLSCTITTPINKIMGAYLSQNDVKAEVYIYRTFVNVDCETVPIFNGIIAGGVQIDTDTKTISAKCVSKSSVFLEKHIPQMIYSAICQNYLGDERCGWTGGVVNATLDTVNGVTITSPQFNHSYNGWYNGGYAAIGDETRMIVKHQDAVITLLNPFNAEVTAGARIEVFPGCDGSPDTCKNKFHNFNHGFSGCTTIPSRNPVMWGL